MWALDSRDRHSTSYYNLLETQHLKYIIIQNIKYLFKIHRNYIFKRFEFNSSIIHHKNNFYILYILMITSTTNKIDMLCYTHKKP